MTPGVPLKSIGFEGSYGFGPATVVVVRARVVGVGAEVVGVGTSKGTTTDDWGAVGGAAVDPDDCTPEVATVVFVDFFFFFFDALVDGLADRVVEVVTDEVPDERVARGAELARSPPLEHAPANIVNATVPQARMRKRILELGMPAAYAPPMEHRPRRI